MHIARELAGQPGVTVLMPGGRLRWEAMSLVGGWGEALLRRVNIRKAFLGGVGLTLEEGLTDVTEEEAEIKRAMGQAAHEVIAIVDHSKWGRAAFATFLQASEVDLVITDIGAPRESVEGIQRLGARVMMVRPDPDPAPPGRRSGPPR
jgi:DeoR/GlpR family transcriptional regulator of sugar metabolism